MLHIGHINMILRAKELGDILVVGVEADELILVEKGRLPIFPLDQRLVVVSSLKWVDRTIAYYNFDYIEILHELRADIFVLSTTHQEKRHIDAMEYMTNNGKRVVILPRTEGISSTDIRKRL